MTHQARNRRRRALKRLMHCVVGASGSVLHPASDLTLRTKNQARLPKAHDFFLTFDLDAEAELKRSLEILGLEKGKRYLPIGEDEPGRRDIEGLLPEEISRSVYSSNVDLVHGLRSNNTQERNEAKTKLKKVLLEAFKASAIPGDAHFGRFYKIIPFIQKALT